MSLFCCSYKAQIPAAAQATRPLNSPVQISSLRIQQRHPFVVPRSRNTQLLGYQQNAHMGSRVGVRWSFAGGSRIAFQPEIARISYHRNGSTVSACWLSTSQIASNAFTLGTVAVLPFYTLMVVAPNAQLTKRAMESIIPYVVLGVLYAYLLYLSWSPDTLQVLFASKYWLPELPGIARMFSNNMSVASAWIHLLVVDLFAARHVFHDGIKNKIETRHSVSLCLFFCPIGIVTHAITKVLTRTKDGRSD